MSQKVHEYEGEAVVVRYDAGRCIHAAECVRGLPGVFDPEARPWVSPDGAAADEVAEVIGRCPTGALTFERRDGGADEAVPETNTVLLAADGPLYARGDLEVVGADGTTLWKGTRAALCRCGASSNKPFCDGRHEKAGFRDPGVFDRPAVGTREGAGPGLKVTVAPGGPLILDGPVEIRAAAGDEVCSGDRAALCRCGASSNKPFCDGSHKGIGFTGE